MAPTLNWQKIDSATIKNDDFSYTFETWAAEYKHGYLVKQDVFVRKPKFHRWPPIIAHFLPVKKDVRLELFSSNVFFIEDKKDITSTPVTLVPA